MQRRPRSAFCTQPCLLSLRRQLGRVRVTPGSPASGSAARSIPAAPFLPCPVTGSPAAAGRLCCISAGCSSLLFTVPSLRRPRRCPDPPLLTAGSRWTHAAPARPGQRHHRASRPPLPRPRRAPLPLTFNSRVPLPRAALPRHRDSRQAPVWLCRGSWCWPCQRPAPRWEPLPALHLFCLYKLLTSFCLAWQAPGPSLPLFTASFKK